MHIKTSNKVHKKQARKGFTLLELLAAILIICALSVIALPIYNRVVEKSRVSEALLTMTSVAAAQEEVYVATNGSYTKKMQDLNVDFTNDDTGLSATGATFNSKYFNFTLLDDMISGERKNGEYILTMNYKTHITYCSPKEHYICSMNMFIPADNSDEEGDDEPTYTAACVGSKISGCQNLNIGTGQSCEGNQNWSCRQSTVESGGICYGNGVEACTNSIIRGTCDGSAENACRQSTIESGGICIGNEKNACNQVTIRNGGKCVANAEGACGDYNQWNRTTYEGTGCCEGAYCPSTAPICP